MTAEPTDRKVKFGGSLSPSSSSPMVVEARVSDVYEKAVILALMQHGGQIFLGPSNAGRRGGCSVTKLKTTLIEMRKKG